MRVRSPEEWAQVTPSGLLRQNAAWRLEAHRERERWPPERLAHFRRETRAFLVEAVNRHVPLREAFS